MDSELDSLNMETLCLLLRKCSTLILNRLDKTNQVLSKIVTSPKSYDNITEMQIQYHSRFTHLINQITNLANLSSISIFEYWGDSKEDGTV